MPKALPLSLPCRPPHSPFAGSSSRSTVKISTPRGSACAVSPQIYCTSSISTDSDSEPPSPSSPDTPVTAALAPRRRSPPPGTPRPVMRASLSRKRTSSNGTNSSAYTSFFGLGPDEDEESEYLLSVNLPGFMPEMVTVSARRDDRLAVIADMWHAEANCASLPLFPEVLHREFKTTFCSFPIHPSNSVIMNFVCSTSTTIQRSPIILPIRPP